MIFSKKPELSAEFDHKLSHAYLWDEDDCVRSLLETLAPYTTLLETAEEEAARLVKDVRSRKAERTSMQSLMHEFSLNTDEGIVLMCIAEALLRIPDTHTISLLLEGKLAAAHWERHLGKGKSLFINASSWSLMFSGRLLKSASNHTRSYIQTFESLVSRMGEPLIRNVLKKMMQYLGQQFVLGTNIDMALKKSHSKGFDQYRYSFDMLGEAALTNKDASRYFDAYACAIKKIGSDNREQNVFSAPSISVKLSALHPRYELGKFERVERELGDALIELCHEAEANGIGLTLDAEEADRLELSLAIFKRVFFDSALKHWQGLGLAVQAYQKRAPLVIQQLASWAKEANKCIPIRLVKGAYWDTEIKRAQERGLESYPVYTRKQNTDASYLACAHHILKAGEVFYPQFATHNAYTVAAIRNMFRDRQAYEFQRLHGMGEQLYDSLISYSGPPCRVYAPVGRYEDLLPYLVRRLLENGANTSFVHRIEDDSVAVEDIVANPLRRLNALEKYANPKIVLPHYLYGDSRPNSKGVNFFNLERLTELQTHFNQISGRKTWRVTPLLAHIEKNVQATSIDILNPHTASKLGEAILTSPEQMHPAINSAEQGFRNWHLTLANKRADCLLRAADLFEEHRDELMFLCVKEGGRSVTDALSEIREAIDFCRYYAENGKVNFGSPNSLPGPTGETNRLSLTGRGIFVCISPWNFPVAIFVGQVAAALMAGNSVIAKPASQTTMCAFRCVQLIHDAGIPRDVLQFLPARGSDVSQHLLSDSRISGVAFTGSTDTAQQIQRTLSNRIGPLATLIAETGGLNVMIADSSALPEQVVADCIQSAFNSAGQRCSALRILCIQEDIADRVIELLCGAMAELSVGDPIMLETDVGPVIDEAALEKLRQHVEQLSSEKRLLFQTRVSAPSSGYLFGPALIELQSLSDLKEEIFGPVLHVVRFKADELHKLADEINATGYGLTFGIHSRIDQTIAWLCEHIRAGNIYVNRNMIGAVVGVQPFGGMGLSGTGPKAGGPHYLQRFATEKTVSINTAAVGGNAQLLASDE
ncbi:MAG: bifunctional proline dehydrogenase/L-glutamate gamma-semialdehyde dehydrogenase PutA [Gammaproteobacteria bacterium]|nr:bifunctional proline dehydrogenase/L-glutamate gamma-semialdehyde dehydrogenase PutA [Gammaproteobacteria bacterium]